MKEGVEEYKAGDRVKVSYTVVEGVTLGDWLVEKEGVILEGYPLPDYWELNVGDGIEYCLQPEAAYSDPSIKNYKIEKLN